MKPIEDIPFGKMDEIAQGCYLAIEPESYTPYNVGAVKELSAMYGIPKNVEFIEAIKHVGASEEELASIYL